jgi:hypothetical protein
MPAQDLAPGQHVTYRTINSASTFLGIERRVCIFGLLCAFEVMRHVGFLEAFLGFLAFWTVAYLATKYDPALPLIVPKILKQKRVYDPGKVLRKRELVVEPF